MLKESLNIYTLDEQGGKIPFPSTQNPAILSEWTYTAERMAGTPTITGTLMHKLCLDDLWTREEFVEFKGVKYYVNQVPTSSKDTDDRRYKHEITLVNERVVLENVFFFDVVTSETEDQYKDRFRSNGTTFSFYGTLNELVSRLNDSLIYSSLYDPATGDGYHIVIDEEIDVSDEKEISLENTYFATAMQEIYNQFGVPYYWKGKTCHVGYTDNSIAMPFEYGQGKGLLSITKTNADYRIVNRITGTGSSDNIPHYYPNKAESRDDPANGGVWITPTGNLMPPIYRESGGASRFYNAKNDTYANPDGGTYEFANPYTDGDPMEGFAEFEDIKPSIKGMKNADGQLLGEIAEVAFDSDDSDEVDEEGNYIHSYFYVKLHKFNGTYGFNLFKQALADGAMTFNMTSGNCAGCAFEVGVSEAKQVDDHYEFDNPVQVYSNGDIVSGSYSDKVNFDNIIARQQDTSKYEVWVALKKEEDTFGVVMPNASNNYKPKAGDTFVITNILMPQVYITNAENELKDALIKYMSENNDEKFSFSITLSRIYLQQNPDIEAMLDENARIIVRYNGHDYTLYVSSYSCKASDDILNEVTVDVTADLSVGQSALRDKISEVAHEVMNGTSADILALCQKYFLSKRQKDAAQGVITFLSGLLSDLIESRDFSSGALGSGYQIRRDAKTGRSYMEVDELYVRLKAYFDTLEIKHLSHVGGRVILSPAGMECVRVEEVIGESEALFDSTGSELTDSGGDALSAQKAGGEHVYRCYFNNTDGEREIVNEFALDDLAQCREFNVKEGVSTGVSNQYYWRKVVGLGDNYIDLSMTDCDTGSGVPRAGDTIVTIGNSTDTARQHAVLLSSYDNDAPSIKLYSGISSYSLLNREVTVISPNTEKNVFTGRMVIKPGSTGFGNLTDAPDIGVLEAEISGAKDDAATAKKDAATAQGSVSDLEDYVDGAFADGIVSEAEAKAIATYLNTVESTSKAAEKSYSELYNNAYLDGSAKVTLANAYSNFTSNKTSLVNAVNNAIADGKATSAEKTAVNTLFAVFNNSYATFAAAIETANKAIQDKLKSYSDNAQKAADEANNNASQAMEDIVEARQSVTELEDYVDGAFADGIISEAEAKAIEKYINTVNATKKEADATYTALYANAYLTGTAKSTLYSAKNSFNTATTNLTNAINSAIADGKTTTAEKSNVDSKFNSFNTAYATLATAIEKANKAIQDKIKEEAVNEAADNVESRLEPISQDTKDAIAKQLGYTDYAALEASAKRGETLIQGGMVNTKLVNADLLVTSALIASAIKANELNVNDKFKVYTDGSVDMNGILHSVGQKTEAILSNGYLRILYNGEEKLRVSVNENSGMPEIQLTHNSRVAQLTAEKLTLGIVSSSSTDFLVFDPSVIGTGNVKKTSDGHLYIDTKTTEVTLLLITIKVSPAGGGSTVPAAGGHMVVLNDSEYVEAIPAAGYQFDRWSDGGAQRHLVTWTKQTTLTAYFTEIPVTKYTVTLKASPTAGGTVSGGGTYEEGTKRTVSASPNTGYRFVKWSDGGYQNHSVTWDANKTLTAYFEAYSVTGDEILTGTDLASGSYVSTYNTSAQSLTVKVASSRIAATYGSGSDGFGDGSWILFNKGVLGGKLEQGHQYRLQFTAQTASGTAAAIAYVGGIGTDGVDSLSEDMIFGDEAGTSKKNFVLEFTAERDSTASDAVCFAFIPENATTVYISGLSIKEI